MANIALCTIIAKNYLPFARTLMASVKAYHPEFRRFVLLVDDPQNSFDTAAEDFAIHSADTIGVPDFPYLCVKYNILELSTAVKPYYLAHLLSEYDLDAVLYFDPDIVLFDDLAPVLDALDTASIVLTPHLTGSLDDDHRPDEWEIMRAGAYNLGFVGVRANSEACRFLAWWQAKLYNNCIIAVEENLFVDQRWVDLVPGMFQGVEILRDPGLNVAYWNLPHRTITHRDGRFLVNEHPLRFFHFSGFRAENYEMPSRYQNRYTMANIGPAAVALFAQYRETVFAYGYDACKDWPYSYGFFEDGSAIPDAFRRLLRDDLALQRDLIDHYRLRTFADIRDFVLDYANQPFDDGQPGTVLITRFAYKLYLSRSDLQRIFPDLVYAHRQPYAEWFVRYARRDYHLGWPVLRVMVESLRAHDWPVDNIHDDHENNGDRDETFSELSPLFAASRAELRGLRDELEQTAQQLRQRMATLASWTRALQRTNAATAPVDPDPTPPSQSFLTRTAEDKSVQPGEDLS